MRSLYHSLIAALFIFALCPVAMAQQKPLNEYDPIDLMNPKLNHANLYIGACETFMSMARKESSMGLILNNEENRELRIFKLMCLEAKWLDHISADCESYLKLEPNGRYASQARQLNGIMKIIDFRVIDADIMTESDWKTIRRLYLDTLRQYINNSFIVLADPKKSLTDNDRQNLIGLRAQLRWALTDELITRAEFNRLNAMLIEHNLP